MTVTLGCKKSIEQSLADILKSENKIEYSCEKCNKKTSKAIKRISYVLIPRIIIFHIHRFHFKVHKRKGMVVEKDDSFIEFPKVIDMEK